MSTLISLNCQVYKAPGNVMMTQKVHYFLDLGFSYFYRIKGMSWITVEYLQQTIYVKTKNHVYMYIKKTSKKLSRPSNPSLGNQEVYLSYLYFTHYRVQVSVTPIQQ